MMTFERNTHENGLLTLTFPAISRIPEVRHAFSTRVGGASTGDYAECNFSYTRGDVKEAVDTNYERMAQVLSEDAEGHSLSISDFVLTAQTHTDHVRHVTRADRGSGTVYANAFTDVDGLVTSDEGVILVTLHADCTPLYFVDPVHRAIGLAHSGWRGTLSGIGIRVALMMKTLFHSDPADIVSVIGPSICETHYEVGQEVKDAFEERFGEDCEKYSLFTNSPILKDKYFFSLERANQMVLERAGLLPEHIHVSRLCTYCEEDLFFSHRRDGEKRGNMAAFLVLT